MSQHKWGTLGVGLALAGRFPCGHALRLVRAHQSMCTAQNRGMAGANMGRSSGASVAEESQAHSIKASGIGNEKEEALMERTPERVVCILLRSVTERQLRDWRRKCFLPQL